MNRNVEKRSRGHCFRSRHLYLARKLASGIGEPLYGPASHFRDPGNLFRRGWWSESRIYDVTLSHFPSFTYITSALQWTMFSNGSDNLGSEIFRTVGERSKYFGTVGIFIFHISYIINHALHTRHGLLVRAIVKFHEICYISKFPCDYVMYGKNPLRSGATLVKEIIH